MRQKEIALVGAGLAGCLLAIYLARREFTVSLFERRPDMRKHPIPAGRSINLSLSARGIHALQQVGLYRPLQAHLVPMPGRMLHDEGGNLRYQPYGRSASAVHYSISRALLNQILLDAAEATGRVRIFFDQPCTGIDFKAGRLFLRQQPKAFRTLIGTDGAGSAVGRAMAEKKIIQCNYDVLPHGYKELTMPAAPEGIPRLEQNALHIWPRGGFMLIALPNTDGSFTATLFLPFSGAESFKALADEKNVLTFFQTRFPDALPLIPNLAREFLTHPTGKLGTVRCAPWHADGKALLLGDAAHAIVPFHGQGMNCAFEDCAIFDRLLEEHTDWESLFQAFEMQRKPNADAIAAMALENYGEMRDAVRDPKFHLRKEIEWLLEERHPERFIARYSMVMFHRIPYAVAQERGEIQAALLNRLSESIDRLEEVDLSLADRLVREKLEPIKISD